jgi:hypothetical protein
MVERTSVYLYAPTKPDTDLDYIEIGWDTQLYNGQEYFLLNQTKNIERSAEKYSKTFRNSMPTKLLIKLENNKNQAMSTP